MIKWFKNSKLNRLRSQLLDWQLWDKILTSYDDYSTSSGYYLGCDGENLVLAKSYTSKTTLKIFHPELYKEMEENPLEYFIKNKIEDIIIVKLYKIKRNLDYNKREKNNNTYNQLKVIKERIKITDRYQKEYQKALKELQENI